jgi:BirA family biotin operon repressor/biotin-[acetyl-CoA-carboxylase] ligase
MSLGIPPDDSLMKLLTVLADGNFHSGEELGTILGVSRTAVWKHLQKLESCGLSIVSVKGKGYCLPSGLELLSEGRIRSALVPEAAGLLSAFDILTVTDSTNARALACDELNGHAHVWLAEQQTAGRGRRGRTWISPFGKNIYLSARWHFEGGAAALGGLSLAVGVVVAQALEDCDVFGIQLKWPNDILWQGRKLGGVLLEMSGDPAGSCQVVVGIGLNVAMPPEAAESIGQPWVDLQQIAPHISRNRLVSSLVSRLLPMLQEYPLRGFSAYCDLWQALDAFAGQNVELRTATRSVSGIAQGVDRSGALRLSVDGEEQLFYGGEISMRAAS